MRFSGRGSIGDRGRRGSALSFAIIVSVVITGLVMTMSWSAGMQSSMASGVRQMDQAFYAAESGAQRVAWYCKNGKMGTITSPLTGTIGGYAYSTSWTTVSGATIRITSRGSLGNVAYTCYMTVIPSASAPAFASAGDFNNKNIDVTGNMQTGGNYSNGGSGSLTGNLVYGGTAANIGSVTGTVTKGTFQAIDATAVGNTLIAAAGLTYNASQSGKTFDFTAVSGANKVIFVNGTVTNPVFIGTGTLVATGDISLSGGFGTAANPVTLVSGGDITTGNNVTIYGNIYAAGDWNRGKVDLTGIVYVGGTSASNNGKSSMTQGPVPWFDPRVSGGGGSSTQFSNFAGPMP